MVDCQARSISVGLYAFFHSYTALLLPVSPIATTLWRRYSQERRVGPKSPSKFLWLKMRIWIFPLHYNGSLYGMQGWRWNDGHTNAKFVIKTASQLFRLCGLVAVAVAAAAGRREWFHTCTHRVHKWSRLGFGDPWSKIQNGGGCCTSSFIYVSDH